MGSDTALEGYLRTAPVIYEMPLQGGGGHQNKKTLVLRGGVAVAAKAGDSDRAMLQASREVAGWLLAVELELGDLFPTTVLRELPLSTGTFIGSAQVMWPTFKDALRGGYDPASVPDEHAWPIAIWDSLTGYQDRTPDNWGLIDDKPHLAVPVDSGHAFEVGQQTNSPFSSRFKDVTLPPEHLARLQVFRERSDTSRLHEHLPDPEMQKLLDRADTILADEVLDQIP